MAAVVLWDADGRLLTVRKHGTGRFMLPGGKPEPSEAPLRTAVRETEEEIGLHLRPQLLSWLGEFTAAAANEPGREVVGDVYVSQQRFAPETLEALRPDAEIDEMRWARPEELMVGHDVAPLLSTRVVPELLASRRVDMAHNGEHACSDPASQPS